MFLRGDTITTNATLKGLSALSGLRFLLLFVTLVLNSCVIGNSGYSFTGADIGNAETISIQMFPNYAALAGPTLSQNFTEALRDKFISQTNLNLIEKNGDLRIEGQITGYDVRPMAIQGNETAALNRLTIAISVQYVNTLEETKSFETSFSRFAEFESTVSLSTVQEQLETEIIEQLVQDIFNKSVINW